MKTKVESILDAVEWLATQPEYTNSQETPVLELAKKLAFADLRVHAARPGLAKLLTPEAWKKALRSRQAKPAA